jgi:putative heme-binding domain-containing protein
MTTQPPGMWMSVLGLVLATSVVVEAQQSVTDLKNEVEGILAQPAGERDLIRLIQLDLTLSDETDSESTAVCREILRTLAMSEDATALEHVRSVFENEPERRSMAACALASLAMQHPGELQDWRYMVRSLTVVQGDDAVAVLSALRRFRIRANKPEWVRRVILIGLELPESQHDPVLALLKHWTGLPSGNSQPLRTIADYQDWFRTEYPDHPAPSLPVEPAGLQWTLSGLLDAAQELEMSPVVVQKGREVYRKAGCQNCHRHGQTGEAFGPDLTSLGWRRQKKEILTAILFPSHDLDEDYPTVAVALMNGQVLNGVASRGEGDHLVIMSSSGVRQTVARSDIEAIVSVGVSAMPSGTLELLNRDEILSLLALLTSVDGIPRPHGDEAF